MAAIPASLLMAAMGFQEPGVEQIMARVAANQERAQAGRAAYVYEQSIQLRFLRGGRKLAREEMREYLAVPGAEGTGKSLVRFSGRYERDGEYLYYAKPGFEYKEMDIDGELMDELADEFVRDEKSRDGFRPDLFPLTSREQAKYRFTLEGREEYRGREVYRIRFDPLPKAIWAGEVLVDAAEFQPVLVTSQLGRRIPILVQTLLGTNLRHLGFKITYDRFGDGVWFPVTYGGEFDLRAVFFYRRKISIAVRNSGFRRTDVTSNVTYDQRSLGR
jgi:hypothetical protein